jgi:N-acetylglucosaminyl-diphospho-decaprenol L-rhamnosyltransferase
MKNVIKLAVIIINYKTPHLVIDCLETLLLELKALDAKVVVVDNDSNDDSCQIISLWMSENDSLNQVDFIASSENTGFSGGNNRGISEIDAEYYLLLNSDTLVRKGAIVSLLDAASKDEHAGLVSPRLEWPDATSQESCFRFHTPISELISSAKTGLITKIFSRFDVPCPVTQEAKYYDWTSFACVLVRADVFKAIGLMDDGYFMYFEDVVFSYKAKQAGWKVLNVPKAHVVHLRGGSSPLKSQAKLRKRLPRYYYESRTRFFYQCYGRVGLLAANLFWTLGWGISPVRQLLSPKFVPNISKSQWRDIWINFSNPLKPFIHPDNYDKT